MSIKPIKIVYVIDSFVSPNAGTEGQLYNLIKGLDRSLFEPRLLVLSHSQWLNNNRFPCPIDILGYSSIKSVYTWIALVKKSRLYKREGIKLAHVFFNDSSIICPPIFKLIGIKTLISRRDMGYWYTLRHKILLPLTGMLVCGVIVNSKAVGKVTNRIEKIPYNRIHTIYNGCNIQTRDFEPIKEILDFKGSSILIALVANIRKIKRIGDAIQALNMCCTSNAKLLIIGNGNAEELKNLVREKGLVDRVMFLGKRSDVPACLQYVDIGLLCSESEGFSNTLVEYQFSGIPVICSDVGGNSEAIIEGTTGFLYPMGNIQVLAEKINILIESRELADKFKVNASAISKKRYSMAAMLSAHSEYYFKTLGYKIDGASYREE